MRSGNVCELDSMLTDLISTERWNAALIFNNVND